MIRGNPKNTFPDRTSLLLCCNTRETCKCSLAIDFRFVMLFFQAKLTVNFFLVVFITGPWHIFAHCQRTIVFFLIFVKTLYLDLISFNEDDHSEYDNKAWCESRFDKDIFWNFLHKHNKILFRYLRIRLLSRKYSTAYYDREFAKYVIDWLRISWSLIGN